MEVVKNNRYSERGGAGVKLLLALVVLILILNAAYNYMPVAYQGESFRQEVDGAIVKATVLPSTGKSPLEFVKTKLFLVAKSHGIPQDAIIDVRAKGKVITAHVNYTKNVELLPFGLYVYTYQFDHISAPSGFLISNS